MAAGNGKDAKPVDTLFTENTHDAGIIEGIGHVVLREARLHDIWPYMGNTQPAEFGMRMLAASIEINGKRLSFDEFGNISVRHMRALQALFPIVNKINGIGDDDGEEEPAKNAEGAESVSAPEGSVSATGS